MTTTLNDLRWKKFPVLDDGFVCLVDVMGDDSSIVQAARVSYGKDERIQWDCNEMGGPPSPHETKEKIEQELHNHHRNKDRGLIRYLMRHKHSTPFEMAELKFLVRVPMDCWRQWIRHRTANVNEYSTRYTEAIDSQQTTKPDEWRLQAKSNKQGSEEGEVHWPEEGHLREQLESTMSPEDYLSQRERHLHGVAREVYEARLSMGVAKEQARKDLPLSTYTEAYWKIDLHNLFHFLGLRMDSHAQKEIRDYATIIGEQIVKLLFPICWEAFSDYRLNGMFLSALDIEAIKAIKRFDTGELPELDGSMFTNKRERDECIAKLERLGIVDA